MSYYTVSPLQISAAIVSAAALQFVAVVAFNSYVQYNELPEVHMQAGKCVKVINYRNGDGYACPDVNVLLRKYRTISE